MPASSGSLSARGCAERLACGANRRSAAAVDIGSFTNRLHAGVARGPLITGLAGPTRRLGLDGDRGATVGGDIRPPWLAKGSDPIARSAMQAMSPMQDPA